MSGFRLLEKSKRTTVALLAAMFLGTQILVPAMVTQSVFADGDDSTAACLDTTANVVGSVEGTGDLVSYDAGSGKIASGVCIKSGNDAFGSLKHSGVLSANGTYGTGNCYTVTGIGTQTVTVARVISESCKNISHIDVVTSTQNQNTPAGTVTFNDLCGTANDAYTVPTTANVTYKFTSTDTVVPAGTYPGTGSVSITAHPAAGFTLTGTTVFAHTFTNVTCENASTPAGTVTFNDVCGTEDDTYTVPTTANVTYKFTGTSDVVSAGTHDGSGTVSITAHPAAGFTLTGNTVFAHTFTNEECEESEKIEICHATSAVVNPYNKIEVNQSAADGVAGNSGGQPDHFGEHTGPIFDPAVNENGDDWGDIIPPIPGVHGGLNWDAFGQAVYNNDCNLPTKVTPANVTFTLPNCEVPTGSYTIPSTTGVQYQVSLNGGSFQNVSAGTHTVAAGSTVQVRAVATDSTVFLTGTTTWSSSFPAATNCVLGEVTPQLGGRGGEVLGAATLADTGEGGSNSLVNLIVGLMAVALALGSAVLSRRTHTA